ncbi:hypothetical protein O181_008895 [Austropuccinia psidii MF-1]|uniref:Uncharacterized protein n=1 Tax=Austropuccinia psidii MF-1 TaxID=1389203 RepID=A0A9Q3GJC2_9BASI|nr:hypothetical protein [Austropuccinia psidii MF-1]
MNDPSQAIPDVSQLKIHDESNAVARADKQAELLNQLTAISEKIQPNLSVSGANFNTWSQNMIESWVTVFLGNVDYFENTSCNTDYRRNLIALAFIQHSVEQLLFDSITSLLYMPNAWNIYHALKNCFNRASWSSIIHHAGVIFNPIDQSSNLTQHAL